MRRVRVLLCVALLCAALAASGAIVLRPRSESMEVELVVRVLNAHTAGNERVEQLPEGRVFTPKLQERVKEFQKHYALVADGVVGSNTLRVMLPTLGRGRQNRPAFVRVLQWYMVNKFHVDVDINGQMNERTLNAIRTVQGLLETTADGIVGSGTWRRMMEVRSDASQAPLEPLVLEPRTPMRGGPRRRVGPSTRAVRGAGPSSSSSAAPTPEGLPADFASKYTARHRASVHVPVTLDAFVRKDAQCSRPAELASSEHVCRAVKYQVPSNWEALYTDSARAWGMLRASWGHTPAGTAECQEALATYRCQLALPKCGAFGVLGACQVSCEDFYAACFPTQAVEMQAAHCVHLRADRSQCGYARMYTDTSAAAIEREYLLTSPISASKADLGSWVTQDKRFGMLRSGAYNIAVRLLRAHVKMDVKGNALKISMPDTELMVTLDYWVSHPLFDEASTVTVRLKASLEAHASGLAGEEPVVDKTDFDVSTLKAHFSNGLMSEVKAQVLEIIKPAMLEHVKDSMPAAVQKVIDRQLNPRARSFMYTDNTLEVQFDGKLMFTNPSDGTLSVLAPQ